MSLEEIFVETLTQYRDNLRVFAIDVGRRFDGERRTQENCVRLHMLRKLPTEEIPVRAEVQELNYRIASGYQVGSYSSNPLRKTGRKEIQPGLSMGGVLSSRGTVGTIGLLGYDQLKENRLSILSCHHVVPGKANTLVTQPGTYLDRGDRHAHIIGKLSRFDPNGDAALIHLFARRNNRVQTPVESNFQVFQTQDIIEGVRMPRIGDVLTKSGRTSGVTEAEVDGIGFYFKRKRRGFPRVLIPAFRLVPIDPDNKDKIEISLKGDSGSVWYDKATKEGVGLLFAGEERKIPHSMEFCWAQQLTDIFERLHFSLTPLN